MENTTKSSLLTRTYCQYLYLYLGKSIPYKKSNLISSTQLTAVSMQPCIMIFCSRNIQISQQSLRNNVNELVSAIVAKVTNDDDDYGNICIRGHPYIT